MNNKSLLKMSIKISISNLFTASKRKYAYHKSNIERRDLPIICSCSCSVCAHKWKFLIFYELIVPNKYLNVQKYITGVCNACFQVTMWVNSKIHFSIVIHLNFRFGMSFVRFLFIYYLYFFFLKSHTPHTLFHLFCCFAHSFLAHFYPSLTWRLIFSCQ